ncbi:hypothetical protein PG987_008949 [Apiospora arundinis]
MDPFTIAATVESSLGLVKLISQKCSSYMEAYKDLPWIIKHIKLECSTWKALLEALKTQLNTNGSSRPNIDLARLGVLGKVRDYLGQLESFVMKTADPEAATKMERTLKAIKWSLRDRQTIHGILNKLSPIKEDLALTLDMDTNFEVHELKHQIQQVESTIIDKNQQIIVLNSIRPRDFTPPETHRQKQALRVQETCDWILRSDLWSDWLLGGSQTCCRFLFIHGMAGSGKTILASALIDELLKIHGKRTVQQRQERKNGFSYYYCSHEHNVDEKRPFLRWIVYDLCRQLGDYVPESLAEATDASEIPDDTLLTCFLSITKQFKERVYIVVDAVDESRSPRDEFLKVLATIGVSQDYKHVSLIATGRPEPDINRAFNASEDKHILSMQSTNERKRLSPQKGNRNPVKKSRTESIIDTQNTDISGHVRLRQERITTSTSTLEQDNDRSDTEPDSMDVDRDEGPQQLLTIPASLRNGCTSLGMDNVYVRRAIEIYVHSMLKEIGFFQMWGEHDAFTLEIQEKLAAKARGMFRLVSCQIETLRNGHLFDQNFVRAAVDDMPETIFDMYRRLMKKWVPGPNAHNHVARNALALICSPTSEIPCAEVLVEAARLDVETNTSLIKFSLKNLREMLGCLVKITTLKRIPESVFQRSEDNVVFRQVLPAHYTVAEFIYDKTTAEDPLLKYFSQTKKSNRILELQIAWTGLTHFGQNRPANNAKTPTRFEEYCLMITDKSLRKYRATIAEEKSIYELVFPCLKYGCPHSSYLARTRRAFPTWLQIGLPGIYARDASPVNGNTSILVSLMLLDWPELAKIFLSTIVPKDRPAIWKDTFTLERRTQRDFPTNSKLVVQPQMTILKACVALRKVSFLQALVDRRATFLEEPSIIYYALERHWGSDPAPADEFATTDALLKSLLDAGADPCPKGYLFTPLQFIVLHLEEPWVHTMVHRLEYRKGNINTVGNPGGKHPYPEEDEDEEDWYDLHPLEICRTATPKWGKVAGQDDALEESRTQIDLLLRQFGAFEADENRPRGSRAAGLVVNISDDDDDALA